VSVQHAIPRRRPSRPSPDGGRGPEDASARPPPAALDAADALRLQRAAGNAAAARVLARRNGGATAQEADEATGAAPAGHDAVVVWFPRNSTQPRQDREMDGRTLVAEAARAVRDHLRRNPGSKVIVAGYASEEGDPARNQRLSEGRAERLKALLVASGISADSLVAVGRGVSRSWPGRPLNRRAEVEVPLDSDLEAEDEAAPSKPFSPRGYTRTEGTAASRLESLAHVAKREGTEGQAFSASVDAFRRTLSARVMAANEGDPLPPDLAVVLRALVLWSRDKGTTWGEGIFDSTDVTLTAAEYATVPAGQNKCNAYVAEVLHGAVGTVHKAIPSADEPGRFFPYRAKQWGDTAQLIPSYPVVGDPRMGDVWSNGSHVGVFLGEYNGRLLYISARDDGDGVFALDKVQHEHGIQIKFMPKGGVYRRYTP
jgi:hypothetical protein